MPIAAGARQAIPSNDIGHSLPRLEGSFFPRSVVVASINNALTPAGATPSPNGEQTVQASEQELRRIQSGLDKVNQGADATAAGLAGNSLLEQAYDNAGSPSLPATPGSSPGPAVAAAHQVELPMRTPVHVRFLTNISTEHIVKGGENPVTLEVMQDVTVAGAVVIKGGTRVEGYVDRYSVPTGLGGGGSLHVATRPVPAVDGTPIKIQDILVEGKGRGGLAFLAVSLTVIGGAFVDGHHAKISSGDVRTLLTMKPARITLK